MGEIVREIREREIDKGDGSVYDRCREYGVGEKIVGG